MKRRRRFGRSIGIGIDHAAGDWVGDSSADERRPDNGAGDGDKHSGADPEGIGHIASDQIVLGVVASLHHAVEEQSGEKNAKYYQHTIFGPVSIYSHS